MAKKKRKNSEKKRNLKYGNISLEKKKKDVSRKENIVSQKDSQKRVKTSDNLEFKKELKRNLVFVGIFLAVLLVLYLLLTRTNLLNPILNSLGLGGLY